jgi:hypothetical protein
MLPLRPPASHIPVLSSVTGTEQRASHDKVPSTNPSTGGAMGDLGCSQSGEPRAERAAAPPVDHTNGFCMSHKRVA